MKSILARDRDVKEDNGIVNADIDVSVQKSTEVDACIREETKKDIVA